MTAFAIASTRNVQGCRLALLVLSVIVNDALADVNDSDVLMHQPMQWWPEARFGKFIHLGVCSVLAAEREGRTDYGEWIRNDSQSSVDTDDTLRQHFDPALFDADNRVRMARQAGMKYVVFTSKHHDGLFLFDSPETDVSYMRAQLRELLTAYGPVGVFRFDGERESTWTQERGTDMYRYVRSLQLNIIINNRVGQPGRACQGRPRRLGEVLGCSSGENLCISVDLLAIEERVTEHCGCTDSNSALL